MRERLQNIRGEEGGGEEEHVIAQAAAERGAAAGAKGESAGGDTRTTRQGYIEDKAARVVCSGSSKPQQATWPQCVNGRALPPTN